MNEKFNRDRDFKIRMEDQEESWTEAILTLGAMFLGATAWVCLLIFMV